MTHRNDFLTRNRDIQRRSRARRKDYIEELEKRVRQYERDGIQATTEVQAAARKVAEENYWLHSLLAKHGIGTEEIEKHVGSCRATSRGLDAGRAEVHGRNEQRHKQIDSQMPHPSAPLLVSSTGPSVPGLMPSERSLGLLSPISIGSSPDHENVLYTIGNPSNVSDARPSHSGAGTIGGRSSLEGPGASSTPCPACHQDDRVRGADETSCEDAARIIASMRGHEDAEGVWPELGCSATRNCMVKNVTIFQMVDDNQ